MTRRWSRAVVVVTGVTALAAPIPIAAAVAPTVSSQWDGSAAADGVRVGVVINGFLFVDNIVDAGGPSAQAAAGSFTGSHAMAAYPYPGEVVMTAHGQTSGAAPNYPLVAQSNNGGAGHDEVQQGPYDVKADSTDDASTAIAQATGDAGAAAAATTRSQAQVVHDPKTGVVTSTAESTTEGFSVKGVFSVGRVHSYARIASPAGSHKPTSDTEFGDVRVGGQEVGVSDKGLVLAGTDVPLPPDSTVNAALSAAGITVHYVAGEATAGSITAPALSVSVVQDVPSVGLTTVSYVLGQASVSAQAPGASTGPLVPTGGTVGGSGPTAAGRSGSTPAAAASGPAPSIPDATGSVADSAAPPQTAPAPSAGGTGYQLAASTGPSSQSLYLVVAGGAIVAVGAAILFRILAVKLAWT